MLELSKVKQVQNIGTYKYENNGSPVKATTQSFKAHLDDASAVNSTTPISNTTVKESASNTGSTVNGTNAAATPPKTSQTEYTDAEWDAQRKKNIAISKLQKADPDIAALERVAPNASEDVKSAWIDASRETGYNGLGYSKDATENTATRLYAEMNTSAKMTDNSAAGVQDILGGTVDSAIDAIETAKQDRLNMTNSPRALKRSDNELEFYDAFLEKLNGLQDGSYMPSEQSTFERINKNNLEVLPSESSNASEEMEVPARYSENAFFHKTTGVDADGNTFELSAKYPADYDPSNPKVEVFTNYQGSEKLYEVSINNLNPDKASQAELYGLFAYVEDDRNIPRSIDPDSSDLYYSALDRKLEILHQNVQDVDKNNQQETYFAETVNPFKTMGNLSYWDRKEILESVYSGS